MERYIYYLAILFIVVTALTLFISYKRAVYVYKKEMDRLLKTDARRELAGISEKIYTTLRNIKLDLEGENSIQIKILRDLTDSIYEPIMRHASRSSLKLLNYIVYSFLTLDEGVDKTESNTGAEEKCDIVDCISILCAYTLLYIQIKAEVYYKRDKPLFLYCIFFTDNIIECDEFYKELIRRNNQTVKELQLGRTMHINWQKMMYL